MSCASSSANNQNYMDNGDQFTQVNINKEVFGHPHAKYLISL